MRHELLAQRDRSRMVRSVSDPSVPASVLKCGEVFHAASSERVSVSVMQGMYTNPTSEQGVNHKRFALRNCASVGAARLIVPK